MIDIKRETIGEKNEIKLSFNGDFKFNAMFGSSMSGNHITLWLTKDEADRIAFQLNSEIQDMERTENAKNII